jgi:hypothetical protein
MPPRAWAAIGASVVTANVVAALTHRATICMGIRSTYHVETVAGRVAFVATWATFSAWWLPHVLDPAKRIGLGTQATPATLERPGV